MRTAILGAGSMGLVLGAYISKAKEQVDLIDINKEHVDELKKNGATIVGTVKMNVPVSAMTNDEVTGKYDLVFLMTKQMHNKSIIESFLPHLNDDAVICTMQNGIPRAFCRRNNRRRQSCRMHHSVGRDLYRSGRFRAYLRDRQLNI